MEMNRSSGILAHPSSFPSRYGIGDLGKGAYDFIDFLLKSKQTLWQILPLNPTGFCDSPYQSFSAFAGNPLLISPDLLLNEGILSQEDLADIPEFDDRVIDYGKVIDFKNTLHRKAYKNFKLNATAAQASDFSEFCKKNEEWLNDYCLFIAVKLHFIQERKDIAEKEEYLTFKSDNSEFLTENEINDYFYGAMWLSWDKDIIDREKDALKKWNKILENEISYQKFLQFIFFKQWGELKAYANGKGVKIIGDLPIFSALDSADVWCNKELFKLNGNGYPTNVAGVPPDYFCETGQLWGNPVYNWQRHKATGYKWWAKRIAAVLSTVDIVRLDHFRGFESYWSVPYGEKNAVKGKWVKGPGRGLFLSIKKQLGSLPVIAEDLGVVTDSVEKLRDGLSLPGMKVLQFGFLAEKCAVNMPHNFKTSNVVAYTGTHDNNTTAGWYREAPEQVKDQFRRYLNVSGDDPAWEMIRALFLSCADYVIIPVQDIMRLGSEARMNFPGTASGNWRFRYTQDMLSGRYSEQLAYLSDISDRNTLLFL